MVICFDWEPLIYILSSQRAAGAGKRYEKYINITHEHLTQKPQYVLCGPVGSNGCFPLQKRLLTPLCRYLLCFTCISVLLWGDGIEGLLFQAANRVVTRIIRLCNDFSGIHYGDFFISVVILPARSRIYPYRLSSDTFQAHHSVPPFRPQLQLHHASGIH